jgi:hypothetical protein
LDIAYLALQNSFLYSDSLIDEVNIYAVADMDSKYNYEKNKLKIKEQELEKINIEKHLVEKRIQLFYLFVAIILIGSGLIIFFHYCPTKSHRAI